jgi:hypothetical protein
MTQSTELSALDKFIMLCLQTCRVEYHCLIISHSSDAVAILPNHSHLVELAYSCRTDNWSTYREQVLWEPCNERYARIKI